MQRVAAAPPPWRAVAGKWFVPFAIGFVIVYPVIIIAINGFAAAR